MNERIIIEKNAVAVDKIGNHVNTWEEYFSCYTYASTYEAQESGDEVKEENRSVTFSVRYCRRQPQSLPPDTAFISMGISTTSSP